MRKALEHMATAASPLLPSLISMHSSSTRISTGIAWKCIQGQPFDYLAGGGEELKSLKKRRMETMNLV
jgi:hypothetical protein